MNPRQDDERYVAELMRSLSDEDLVLDDPPVGLFDHIARAVDDEDRSLVLAPSAGPPTEPAAMDGASRRVRRWNVLLAATAAAAVIAVVVLAGAVMRREGPPEGEVAARARLTSESLPNPNDLNGGALLVEIDGRREIDLHVKDLPASAGSFYELWLLAPDGTRLQSLGTTDGHGRYLVPAAIDPREFPVVDVSREPPDGNPAHSGDSLVRGRLDL